MLLFLMISGGCIFNGQKLYSLAPEAIRWIFLQYC